MSLIIQIYAGWAEDENNLTPTHTESGYDLKLWKFNYHSDTI